MKTTIDLPDALAEEAKRLALDEGTTLRELVVSGLRHEVATRRERPRTDFVFPTSGGSGLIEPLTPQEIMARSYGMPA